MLARNRGIRRLETTVMPTIGVLCIRQIIIFQPVTSDFDAGESREKVEDTLHCLAKGKKSDSTSFENKKKG